MSEEELLTLRLTHRDLAQLTGMIAVHHITLRQRVEALPPGDVLYSLLPDILADVEVMSRWLHKQLDKADKGEL